MKQEGEFYMWLFLGILFFIFAIDFAMPTDSTDKSRWKRSGLSLYTDNATGVQYVKGGYFGSITVRVDKNGKPFTDKLEDSLSNNRR